MATQILERCRFPDTPSETAKSLFLARSGRNRNFGAQRPDKPHHRVFRNRTSALNIVSAPPPKQLHCSTEKTLDKKMAEQTQESSRAYRRSGLAIQPPPSRRWRDGLPISPHHGPRCQAGPSKDCVGAACGPICS